MGSMESRLRSAVASGDQIALQEALRRQEILQMLQRPLNRHGDTALALAVRHGKHHLVVPLLQAGCAVNTANKDGDTPLDIILKQVLPPDDSILHDHFCPFAQCEHNFTIPEVVLTLLRAGACASSLQRLVMHVMKDAKAVNQLCCAITGLESEKHFRLSGLLLQVTAWFHQEENLRHLFQCGINPENFWQAVFLPEVVPTASPLLTWQEGDSCDYSLPQPDTGSGDADGVQSLKFSFAQDWRAEWDDGENPAAQYRADLQLTPEAAILFSKAAHCYAILWHIMRDVMKYIPPLCGGPNLKESVLLQCIAEAGYNFTEEEMRNLSLKFGVDFTQYRETSCKPKPLKHLCRLTVRFNLRSNVFHALQHLQFLPEPIKQYIGMDD